MRPSKGETLESSVPQLPTLPALIETASSIVRPTVVWPAMDSYIEILAQIELYRIEAFRLAENLYEDDEDLRAEYLAKIFLVKRVCIARRIRSGLVPQAEECLETYWPAANAIRHHPTTPLELAAVSMTADERAEYDAERAKVSMEINEMVDWRKNLQKKHPNISDRDLANLFDAKFKDVTGKRWVDTTISWMAKVSQVVESIVEAR